MIDNLYDMDDDDLYDEDTASDNSYSVGTEHDQDEESDIPAVALDAPAVDPLDEPEYKNDNPEQHEDDDPEQHKGDDPGQHEHEEAPEEHAAGEAPEEHAAEVSTDDGTEIEVGDPLDLNDDQHVTNTNTNEEIARTAVARSDEIDTTATTSEDTSDNIGAQRSEHRYNLQGGDRSRSYKHRLINQMEHADENAKTYDAQFLLKQKYHRATKRYDIRFLRRALSKIDDTKNDVFEYCCHFLFNQMTADAGIRKHGQVAIDALYKELCVRLQDC